MHNACKLFGLTVDSLLNSNVSVGGNRQFKVSVTDQDRTVMEFVNEILNSALWRLSCPIECTYHDPV